MSDRHMSDAMDWDYAAIRDQMQRNMAPPFKTGAAAAGQHCPHCPMDSDAHCPNTCSAEYEKFYGVKP